MKKADKEQLLLVVRAGPGAAAGRCGRAGRLRAVGSWHGPLACRRRRLMASRPMTSTCLRYSPPSAHRGRRCARRALRCWLRRSHARLAPTAKRWVSLCETQAASRSWGLLWPTRTRPSGSKASSCSATFAPTPLTASLRSRSRPCSPWARSARSLRTSPPTTCRL